MTELEGDTLFGYNSDIHESRGKWCAGGCQYPPVCATSGACPFPHKLLLRVSIMAFRNARLLPSQHGRLKHPQA